MPRENAPTTVSVREVAPSYSDMGTVEQLALRNRIEPPKPPEIPRSQDVTRNPTAGTRSRSVDRPAQGSNRAVADDQMAKWASK